jgi:transposase
MLWWVVGHCSASSAPWTVGERAVAGARSIWPAGITDMRRGAVGLAMLVQQSPAENTFYGALYAFRGRRAGLIKLIWHDGTGLCMLTKRIEQGRFRRRSATTTGRISLSAPQLAALRDGCEWRAPMPLTEMLAVPRGLRSSLHFSAVSRASEGS